jgi:hypothetical protein
MRLCTYNIFTPTWTMMSVMGYQPGKYREMLLYDPSLESQARILREVIRVGMDDATI